MSGTAVRWTAPIEFVWNRLHRVLLHAPHRYSSDCMPIRSGRNCSHSALESQSKAVNQEPSNNSHQSPSMAVGRTRMQSDTTLRNHQSIRHNAQKPSIDQAQRSETVNRDQRTHLLDGAVEPLLFARFGHPLVLGHERLAELPNSQSARISVSPQHSGHQGMF